jgi:hypothetical protein
LNTKRELKTATRKRASHKRDGKEKAMSKESAKKPVKFAHRAKFNVRASVPTLAFGDGRLGLQVAGNTLLIYGIEKRPIGESTPHEEAAPLVCAWRFDDPRSVFVLMRALAVIGMKHQQEGVWLARGFDEEKKP